MIEQSPLGPPAIPSSFHRLEDSFRDPFSAEGCGPLISVFETNYEISHILSDKLTNYNLDLKLGQISIR